MELEIARFVPAEAAESEFAECYELAKAVHTEELPSVPFVPYAAYAEQLRRRVSGWGPQRVWTARSRGRLAGIATVSFPEHENLHLAIARVRVAAELRQRGIGTALLRATSPDVCAAGRGTVGGVGVKSGRAGEQWALALGLTKVREWVLQSLVVADVDPELWSVPPPDGFRAVRWVGAAAPELVGAYARARTAITDAPAGESSMAFPEWSVERVRSHEADVRGRSIEARTVVAVREASGVVAGLTEVHCRAIQPQLAVQQDTAALADFRGHGLGRFIKAEMMRWLLSERPEVEQVVTSTAADNVHMIRVNHETGYVTDFVTSDVGADIAVLDGWMEGRTAQGAQRRSPTPHSAPAVIALGLSSPTDLGHTIAGTTGRAERPGPGTD